MDGIPLYLVTRQEVTAIIIGFSIVSGIVSSNFSAMSSHIVNSMILPLSI
jgi:hypothetical protein